MSVTITCDQKWVRVQAPSNTQFSEGAVFLSGEWDGSTWVFQARFEREVRALCARVYGSEAERDLDIL